MSKILISTKEIVRSTSITARMLQVWDETGLICPTHSNHKRLYTVDEFAMLLMIEDLRKKGVSLQRCRAIVQSMIDHASSGKPITWAVYDARDRITFVETPNEVVEVAARATQPVYITHVAGILDRLIGKIAA